MLAAAHTRLQAVLNPQRTEDPENPETVQAMPLVLHLPKGAPPRRPALLAAAARACVAVCLSPRAGSADPGDAHWGASLGRWYDAKIRKIARRARASKWDAVQSLDGVSVEQDGAEARAFLPTPVHSVHPLLGKLQISGADLPVEEASFAVGPEAELGSEAGLGSGAGTNPGSGQESAGGLLLGRRVSGAASVTILVDRGLGMTVGKAAAQVAHGSMCIAAALPVATVQEWAGRGFDLEVREVPASEFAAVREVIESAPAVVAQRWMHRLVVSGDAGEVREAAVVIRDAGHTEVRPGSATVIAIYRA